MDIIVPILILLLAAFVFFRTKKSDDTSSLEDSLETERNKTSELEQKLAAKEVEINNHQKNIGIGNFNIFLKLLGKSELKLIHFFVTG